jgi:hypothetical protein
MRSNLITQVVCYRLAGSEKVYNTEAEAMEALKVDEAFEKTKKAYPDAVTHNELLIKEIIRIAGLHWGVL